MDHGEQEQPFHTAQNVGGHGESDFGSDDKELEKLLLILRIRRGFLKEAAQSLVLRNREWGDSQGQRRSGRKVKAEGTL